MKRRVARKVAKAYNATTAAWWNRNRRWSTLITAYVKLGWAGLAGIRR